MSVLAGVALRCDDSHRVILLEFRRETSTERVASHHVVEPTTKKKYTYLLHRYVMLEFGPMRMIDVMPEHVRGGMARYKRLGLRVGELTELRVKVLAMSSRILTVSRK